MKEKDSPTFDFGEDESHPDFLHGAGITTESIDLGELLPYEASTSGSFALQGVEATAFGKLLNALPTPAMLLDRAGIVTFANESCERLAERRDQIRGCRFSSFLPSRHSPNAESWIVDLFADRKPRVAETLLKIGNRSIWGRVYLRSMRLRAERAILVLVEDLTAEKKRLLLQEKHEKELQQAHDELEQRVKERTGDLLRTNEQLTAEIAHRNRIEECLRKEKDFSDTVIDSLPGIFYLFDRQGRFLRWNNNLERVSGCTREEISALSVQDLFSGATKHIVSQAIRGAFISGELSVEAELLSADGHVTPYLLSIRRVTLNQEQCLLGMGMDITERKRAIDALQASEARYRTLFDESRDGIFISTPEGRLLEANQSFVDIFGYTKEEMMEMNLAAAYADPSHRDKTRKEIERAGTVKDYPLWLKRKDGSKMDCMMTATLRRALDGTILGYQGIVREVTERVQAEKRIREQNSFLNSLLESVTHPFYVVDADNHSVLMANSAAHRTFSTEGSTCYALTHSRSRPCDTSQHPCPLEEVKKTRRPVTLEHVHYDNEGNAQHVEIHAYPILGSDGNVSKIIEYTLEVTERRRWEQALKESEERMRLVIEASPIGIAIVQDGRYVYANPAFAGTFGYEREEAIIGVPGETLFAEEDRAVLTKRGGDILQGNPTISSWELRGLRREGKSFQASLWLAAIKFKEKPSLLGFVIDVSEEKGLRAQLLQAQKLEAIGTLAGGIAHDFNNLLTIILGFSELLLAEKCEGDRDYLDLLKIAQAARNGADLVQRILTFSRKVETKLRPLDLNHEVRNAQKLLQRTIPKMIDIELTLDRDLKRIHGDPGQIEQLLLNLAVNAQHAMPQGGRLAIETKHVNLDEHFCKPLSGINPGLYALLSVSDTGHGMSREIIEHIFEPFYTTKKQGEGTGLGLAMVFGIVKSHGGHIECLSEQAVGTTFKIFFPVIEMPDQSAGTTTAALPKSGTETVLLVDDEELIRDLGTQILSRAGYHVLTASTGGEALDVYRIRRDQISLVVLDLIMPLMGGKQCLEELLEMNPRARVLVSSGFSLDGPAKEAMEAGAAGFVSKPFNITEMLTAIRAALDSDDQEVVS